MEKILQNLWKISLVLELLCCFRIAGEISFFRPLSLGALFHRENTVMNHQNTKCHFSPNIIFFRYFWYFSITKAIYSYVLAKFEQISMFFIFNTSARFLQTTTLKPLFKFYPMLWYCLQRINSFDGIQCGLILAFQVFEANGFETSLENPRGLSLNSQL